MEHRIRAKMARLFRSRTLRNNVRRRRLHAAPDNLGQLRRDKEIANWKRAEIKGRLVHNSNVCDPRPGFTGPSESEYTGSVSTQDPYQERIGSILAFKEFNGGEDCPKAPKFIPFPALRPAHFKPRMRGHLAGLLGLRDDSTKREIQ